MKRCPNCAEENSRTANYCVNCGARFEREDRKAGEGASDFFKIIIVVFIFISFSLTSVISFVAAFRLIDSAFGEEFNSIIKTMNQTPTIKPTKRLSKPTTISPTKTAIKRTTIRPTKQFECIHWSQLTPENYQEFLCVNGRISEVVNISHHIVYIFEEGEETFEVFLNESSINHNVELQNHSCIEAYGSIDMFGLGDFHPYMSASRIEPCD